MIGKTLGHYEITSPLGAGGMGAVYRAKDRKLGREVAIKVLPEAFARDPDRVARFQREAKLLASLNHPNIAVIHGLEEAEGISFLVLELVEGDTLADQIRRGPVPVEESLKLALQITEALEAAHEKGVIHRDLKPANIKVTPDGKVKVLDFGLAKALEREATEADASQSPTLSLAATKAGVILGTAAYMSPEQARGAAVDRRCDIWSFGVVLFEMLTGKQLFAGETISDTLAAVLRADVDWNLLPENTPTSIRTLLRRCLTKDRKQRLQAIGDARIVIEEYISNPSGASAQEGSAVAVHHKHHGKFAWILATAFALTVVAFAIFYFRRGDVEMPVMRLLVGIPSTPAPVSLAVSFAISPNGRDLVYVASEGGKQRLMLRPIDQLKAQELPGTEGAIYPFWSPDSKSVGFFADRMLKRIDIEEGPPQPIANAPNARGGTWNKNDVIVFAPEYQSELYSVSAKPGSSKPVPFTQVDRGSHSGHIFPQFLPDGRQLLFYAWGGKNPGIYLTSLDLRETRRLPIESKLPAAYASASPGYLLFMQERTLFAQLFDEKRGELSGKPAKVADSVENDDGLFLGGFSTSDTGVLAYRPAAAGLHQLAWFDRNGNKIKTLGEPDENGFGVPELSPDGERLAAYRATPDSKTRIWLIQTAQGLARPLLSDTRAEVDPIWSPDGSKIAFCSTRGGRPGDLYAKTLSTGKDELILDEPPQVKWTLDWAESKDGHQYILYKQLAEGATGLDLWALPLFGERKPILVANSTSNEGNGKFSPDVKWVAYESDESGQPEVYIQPFPGPGDRKIVSKNGGITPRWSNDGKELFYVSDNKLKVVSIQSDGQNLKIGDTKELFNTRISTGGYLTKHQYDVSRDGQRFLINLDESSTSPITIVTNWAKALKK